MLFTVKKKNFKDLNFFFIWLVINLPWFPLRRRIMYFPFGASHIRPLWPVLLWWASLNCFCLSVTAIGWTAQTTAASACGASPHLCTHFIYSADWRLCFLLCLASTHTHTHTQHFILPRLYTCLPKTVWNFYDLPDVSLHTSLKVTHFPSRL